MTLSRSSSARINEKMKQGLLELNLQNGPNPGSDQTDDWADDFGGARLNSFSSFIT